MPERPGFEHKIVDGMLWLRSSRAMLGYLNAPSPFDADGWFNTQDLVERDGEYIRILGRKSELINVGGEKVHPTEVENVLLQIDNVKDVTVRGVPNAVTGELASVTTRAGCACAASRPPLMRERCLRTVLISPIAAPDLRSARVTACFSASARPAAGAIQLADAPPEMSTSTRSPAPA